MLRAIDVPEPVWHEFVARVLLFGCREAEMACEGRNGGRVASRSLHQQVNIADSTDAVFLVSRCGWLMTALWKCCGHGSDRIASVINYCRHLIKSCRDNDLEGAAALARALTSGALSSPAGRTGCWSFARTS